MPPLSRGAAKPTQPIPPLGLTLGILGEGGNAAEPDVVDHPRALAMAAECPGFQAYRLFGAGRIYSFVDGTWMASDVATRR